MRNNLYFVFLTYSKNNEYDNDFYKLISNYTKSNYLIINTFNNDYLECGESINFLYEFSGYQKALEIIKSKLKNSERIQIIFVNDTIFRSHLKILVCFLINHIIKYYNYNKSFIIGVKQKTPFLMKDIVQSEHFLPTYLFSLVLHVNEIDKLYLFDPIYSDVKMLYQDQDFNNINFIAHINNWLLPKSFIGGWYQSSPTSSLGDIHFLRKKVTIFLEAKLQNTLNNQNIPTVYVLDDSKYLRFLMILDRIYIIYLKIQLRIRNYFLKVICG